MPGGLAWAINPKPARPARSAAAMLPPPIITVGPIGFDTGATGGDGYYEFYTIVTDNDNNAIIRCVVCLVEVVKVLFGPGRNVGGPAYNRKLVGMSNECGCIHLLVKLPEVVVVNLGSN